jgi:hypothetical protein
MFSFSENIAKFSIFTQAKEWFFNEPVHEHIKKINNLTTVAAVDLEINKMKEKIRLERIHVIILIAGGQALTQEKINKIYEAEQTKRIDEEAEIKQRLAQKPNPQFIFHDPNMPQSTYDALCESIQEEGINPHNINLKYLPDLKNEQMVLTLASADDFPSPQITIYESLTTQAENFQLFTYKHEIFHILLRHELENIRTRVTYKVNSNSLISILEREANIRAASTSIELSETGMERICTQGGHPKIINNYHHCGEMKVLYELMKKKEELKKLS